VFYNRRNAVNRTDDKIHHRISPIVLISLILSFYRFLRISYRFTLLTDMQRGIAFHSVTDLPPGAG
jgi:hypothetical protein